MLDTAVHLHKTAQQRHRLDRSSRPLDQGFAAPNLKPAAIDETSSGFFDAGGSTAPSAPSVSGVVSTSSAAAEAETKQKLLQRLGSEYMRLLPTPAMEPLLSVRLLHAFSEVGQHPGVGVKGLQEICRHMCTEVLPALRAASPDHLLTLLWAVAKLSSQERVLVEEKVSGSPRPVHTDLFNQAANSLFARVHTFQFGQLSYLTQTFAMAGFYYYPLLNTIASAARLKLREYDPSSLTNLVRCLARLNFSNESFFNDVAERVPRDLESFQPHQAATLAKSFAQLKLDNKALYEALSVKIQSGTMKLSSSQVTP